MSGPVSLIIGAIALPILFFLMRYGIPRVKALFNQGMKDLEDEVDSAKS